MSEIHPKILASGSELAYVGHTRGCSRERTLDVFPGCPYKFKCPEIGYAVRPLEGIVRSGAASDSVNKWQHAFREVGKDQSKVVIYWIRFEAGSGAEEFGIVQRLGTILQGARTQPEGSESGYVYMIYTPIIVAKQLRACSPVPAHKK